MLLPLVSHELSLIMKIKVMPKEIWTQWKPAENLSARYHIDLILEGIEGFKLIMSDAQDDSKKLTMLFENSVFSYRNTDESFSRDIVDSLRKEYGQEFWEKWIFFKVLNSNYLNWLAEESYGFFESDEATHFSIIAMNSILDIADNSNPKIIFHNL